MENSQSFTHQRPLPNATAVLVLGIISIIGCFCYGIVGLICGIIALVLASKDKAKYNATPELYNEASLKNLNAGRICAIIGTILSAIYLAMAIFFILTVGFEVLNNPTKFFENMK